MRGSTTPSGPQQLLSCRQKPEWLFEHRMPLMFLSVACQELMPHVVGRQLDFDEEQEPFHVVFVKTRVDFGGAENHQKSGVGLLHGLGMSQMVEQPFIQKSCVWHRV